jgi:hypothetical protein
MRTLNDQNETTEGEAQRTEIHVRSKAGAFPNIRYNNRDRPNFQIEALTLSDLSAGCLLTTSIILNVQNFIC